MVVVRLKSVHSATKRLASGKRVTYHYAWRGGPRLTGAPGSPEFVRSYQEAHAASKRPLAASVAFLVASYRVSPEFTRLAASTRKQWARWLDEIQTEFGTMPLTALADRRVRAVFHAWRDKWADRPRSADYAIQVLSRVFSFAEARGLIDANPAKDIEDLYESDRADVIWTPQDIAAFDARARNPWVSDILHVACLTGLRRGDLARLTWDHVGATAIIIRTRKGRKDALVPILPELADRLAAIKARQSALAKSAPNVLTTSFGKPWSESGLTHAIGGTGKRLHDCRGTFATRLRVTGLPASKIADVLAWEEGRVERLLAVYVDREAIVMDIARTLATNRLTNRNR